MGLLGSIFYDPASAATKSTASLLAMTAFDTTNLRITFTAPANGYVLVRIRCTLSGATTYPTILLGVLESTTVVARVNPQGGIPGAAIATNLITQEALFVVPGVTSGSHTWDAAYGVEIVLASTSIKYGGPNNASGANAQGGIMFEVWDCPNILGAKLYDPVGAVSKVMTSLLAMTALDTANLRVTFTAPTSGKVLVRVKSTFHGSTTYGQCLLGVLDGSTVRVRQAPLGALKTTSLATTQVPQEAEGVVTGLTPGSSYSFDAAYAVQVVSGAGGLKYGGPNNTTTNDAFGASSIEVWAI